MSRAEIDVSSHDAFNRLVEQRARERAAITADVRALAASASPRIRPDRKAIAAELKGLRSFHANQKQKALALDVELIDLIVDLLEK